jgi:rhodanese-related sulfurtransferase
MSAEARGRTRRLGTVLTLLASLLPLGTSGAGQPAVTKVDGAAVQSLAAEGAKVIDVRRPEEWRSTGVIPGSHRITAFDAEGNLQPGFLPELEALVDRGEPLVVICRSGNRSAKISTLLTDRLGYTRVYDAAGGMLSWIGEGRPTAGCC